jgi:hypothetical protein
MTKVLKDQYDAAIESKDIHQLDRTVGATFLFLATINALTQDPVIPLDPLPVSFGKFGKNLPAFGYLKRLT